MKIEIKNRWTGAVIYSRDCESMKECVEAAVREGVNLGEADFTREDLSGGNFSGGKFYGAAFIRASLDKACFDGAQLVGTTFFGAYLLTADMKRCNAVRAQFTAAHLSDANFSWANLSDSQLDRAVVARADFTGTNLFGISFDGADITDAILTPVRDNIWAILALSPHEVPDLRAAIAEGRINGSAYEGDCACLVGTLAKSRGCRAFEIPGLKLNPNRPSERFFASICPGDTPATSQFSRLALEWVDQWLEAMRGVFAPEQQSC